MQKIDKKPLVVLVGTGPGDRGLITVEAMQYIRKADVIVYDNLIPAGILNEAKLSAELIYAGKQAGRHELSQKRINELLVEKAVGDRLVLRLKGGDPYVFGRGAEEARYIRAAGVECRTVCGVSSLYSVPAAAGISLTDREICSSFHAFTGHRREGESAEPDYKAIAGLEGSLVFFMGLAGLSHICGELIRAGKPESCPAAVISEGTTSRQRVIRASLYDIAKKAEEAGLKTPALIFVGEAAAKEREIVDKGSDGALSGIRVLMTGSREFNKRLGMLLEDEGADALPVSIIECIPRRDMAFEEAVLKIESFSHIVFTSGNGVRAFFEYISGNTAEHVFLDRRRLAHISFAVIGEGTARELENFGYKADFIPSEYTGSRMAEEWVPTLEAGACVLIIRAEEAGEDIDKALLKAGIGFQTAPIYKTVRDYRRRAELNRYIRESEYAVLASGSAARAMAEMLDENNTDKGSQAKFIAIGPVTAGIAAEAGLKVYAAASKYSTEGIRDAIIQIENGKIGQII